VLVEEGLFLPQPRRGAVAAHVLADLRWQSDVPEHQIEVWCSESLGLVCSVNDAVNDLPCATYASLNDRLS